MAFPAVQSRNESSTSTAGTSHVVNLPSGITAGDLIVIILDKGSTAATFNALTGWNELVDENAANGITVWVRDADGTEGATVTFTSSANTRSAEVAYRISGAATYASRPPELSTVATGTSVNPNATTCTPTGGAKDYLWITFFGMAGEQADDDTLVTTTPTNYTNTLQKTCGVAGTNLGGMIAAAEWTNNAASEDAGQWVAVDNAAWRAYTLAVHPTPNATATPATINVTVTFDAPTLSAGSTVEPATINAFASFAAAEVDVTVAPLTIDVVATALDPVASSGGAGDATATPATIDITATPQAPALSAGATASPAVTNVTATPQAPTLSAGATITPKSPYRESFNKADGTIGPDLTWTHRVFSAGEYAVAGNQAVYAASGAGVFEDLQIPTVPTPADDVVVSLDVTDISFTGSDLWVSAGVLARVALINSDTSYRGYAVEINRNDQIIPGTFLWTVIIWRVDDGLAGTATNIGAGSTANANVTLPGTLTVTVKGNRITAAFTHVGAGGTINASATDGTYGDGTVGLGAGHTLGAGDSGSVTVDNFRVDLPETFVATANPQAPTLSAGSSIAATEIVVTATPQAATLSAGQTASPVVIDVVATALDATTSTAVEATPATLDVTAIPQGVTTSAGASATPATIDVTATPQNPAASGGGSATAAPDAIVVTATPQDATLSAGQTASPATIDVVATPQAASASSGQTAAPATIDVVAAPQSPTLSAGQTATPAAIDIIATPQAPTLSAGWTVTSTVIAVTATALTPTASAGSDATAAPASIDATITPQAPALSAGSSPTPDVIAVVASAQEPALSAGSDIAVAALLVFFTALDPTVSVFAGVISPVIIGLRSTGSRDPLRSSSSRDVLRTTDTSDLERTTA